MNIPPDVARQVTEVEAHSEGLAVVPVTQIREERRIVGQAAVRLDSQRHADPPGVWDHLVKRVRDLTPGGGVHALQPRLAVKFSSSDYALFY